MDEASAEFVSQVFKALSSKERIVALELFDKSKLKLMDVSARVGMSRSGFQNIVDDFREEGLIEQAEHRSRYSLSVKGKKVLSIIEMFAKEMSPIEALIKRQQLKASLAKFGTGLTKEELLKILEESEKEKKT